MGNWFKYAKDFSERNLLNSKIRYLSEVKETLNYISKLIYQSGKNAKNTNYSIIISSKISSYPTLHDILIEADVIALDSPKKFALLCQEGILKIDELVGQFTNERNNITYPYKRDKPMKGWVDNE